MKKRIKIVFIMQLVIFCFALTACKPKDNIQETEGDIIQRIIYETNGGQVITPATYEKNEFPEDVVAATKEGCTFLGWFLDNGIYDIPLSEINKKELEGNVILYAKWDNPRVLITMENGDKIRMELYPNIAPATVANFLGLVDEKYYDKIVFHRVIKDFMIQAGGYYLDGHNLTVKEHKSTIVGEFNNAGFTNDLHHEVGVLSMAREEGYINSASTQFFICSANSPHLDGDYAAFGKVIDQKSLNVVMDINLTQTVTISNMAHFPLVNGEGLVMINSITRID